MTSCHINFVKVIGEKELFTPTNLEYASKIISSNILVSILTCNLVILSLKQQTMQLLQDINVL